MSNIRLAIVCGTGAAALGIGVSGCASSPTAAVSTVHADADDAQRAQAGPAPEYLPVESSSDVVNAQDSEAPAAQSGASLPTETIAAAPEPAPLVRADGRPAWWVDAPVAEGSQVRLCAEYLGADLVSARRGAISAARNKLRDVLALGAGDRLEGQRIVRISAVPLPPAQGAQVKYAAYVEMVADRPS